MSHCCFSLLVISLGAVPFKKVWVSLPMFPTVWWEIKIENEMETSLVLKLSDRKTIAVQLVLKRTSTAFKLFSQTSN